MASGIVDARQTEASRCRAIEIAQSGMPSFNAADAMPYGVAAEIYELFRLKPASHRHVACQSEESDMRPDVQRERTDEPQPRQERMARGLTVGGRL